MFSFTLVTPFLLSSSALTSFMNLDPSEQRLLGSDQNMAKWHLVQLMVPDYMVH
jgi:hypothetical protein